VRPAPTTLVASRDRDVDSRRGLPHVDPVPCGPDLGDRSRGISGPRRARKAHGADRRRSHVGTLRHPALAEIVRGRPVVALGFGTSLWINWAWIVLEHRDDARLAREEAGQPTQNRELQASMIAIDGAAFAIDGFAAGARDFVISPTTRQRAARPTVVSETLAANFDVGTKSQAWLLGLRELWLLRANRIEGGLAHPKTVFGKPVALPATPGPSPARMTYTVERATWATSLMTEIVSTCDAAALRPGLDGLADKVRGFSTYVAEFVGRP